MEFIECILRGLFLYYALYVIYEVNIENKKMLTILVKQEEDAKEEERQEQIRNLCDDLTQMKSLYKKSNDTIKQIVKKLPFKGEEWMQDYIRDEINENYGMNLENINQ